MADGNGSFIFNLALHASILFTILSLFFMLYVSKLEVSAIQSELKSNIKSGVAHALVSANPSATTNLVASIGALPFSTLTGLYSQLDPVNAVTNQCLFKDLWMAMAGLYGITLFIYAYYRDTIPLLYILAENAAIFLFVGAIELLFFFYVASKFIPVPPSLIVTSSVQALRGDLGSAAPATATPVNRSNAGTAVLRNLPASALVTAVTG
jgi:hypothetical protein